MHRIRNVIPICLLVLSASTREAQATEVYFETHVRGIFKTHCFHCHGEENETEGGLDVRLVRLMFTGGDSGAAIVPGNPEESLLFQKLLEGEMPPDEAKQISPQEIAVIGKWIESGAQTARPEPKSADQLSFITPEELNHWAYQPIRRPTVPTVNQLDLCRNPIDRFLLQRLETKGFGFSDRADPATLVRRLHFDLHGLPPTPEKVAEYVSRDSIVAWSGLIDELLSSHHYGERWARHWLDIAGYSDSEGYTDADPERKHAWRYRDYVIRSLIEDKPYDQFIIEQLAGDELVRSPHDNLASEDVALLAATGFLRMAPDGTGGSVPDLELAKNESVADTIKIVSSSLLAMTVGCAQCHDHRYDPISQVDYYRFRAIFEPTLDVKHWRKPAQRLISLYNDQDRAEAARIEAEAAKTDSQRKKLQAEFIAATFEKQLEQIPQELHANARKAHATSAKQRTDQQKALFKKYPQLNVTASSLYLYDRKADQQLKDLAAEAKQKRDAKPKQGFVRAATEVKGQIPVTHVFYRGDHQQPKQEVQPGGLSVITAANADLIQVNELAGSMSNAAVTSGRRLAFARRLVDRRHPLTARVIVNRIWAHHFGRGLVTSTSDFGKLGSTPSHQELLDWLAIELIESGWSLKHIHRLILNSSAWQQRLRDHDELEQIDPDNELLGGANLIRLDAETLRDSMLLVGGELNADPFGPPVPVMADRVGRIIVGKENLNAGRPGPVIDMRGEDLRRSVYIQVRRSRPLSVLETFDQPPMTPNCDRRRPSTVSTQSLLMLNSDLVVTRSRAFASRLMREADQAGGRITRAWELAYSRPPTEDERSAANQLLSELTREFESQSRFQAEPKKTLPRTADEEALAVLCQTLLSSNEFLYID